MDCSASVLVFHPHHTSSLRSSGFAFCFRLCAWTRSSSRALRSSFCVPPSIKQESVVQESQPVVHRLQLSLSAKVPTYPERTNLPQETLDFRWAGFSPALRYSCQHSLSCTLHRTSRSDFDAYTMLLYHTYVSIASVPGFSPVYLRRRATRLVSYYALLK